MKMSLVGHFTCWGREYGAAEHVIWDYTEGGEAITS